MLPRSAHALLFVLGYMFGNYLPLKPPGAVVLFEKGRHRLCDLLLRFQASRTCFLFQDVQCVDGLIDPSLPVVRILFAFLTAQYPDDAISFLRRQRGLISPVFLYAGAWLSWIGSLQQPDPLNPMGMIPIVKPRALFSGLRHDRDKLPAFFSEIGHLLPGAQFRIGDVGEITSAGQPS